MGSTLTFLFLSSCLTIVRIMGFPDYGISGKYVLAIPFLNSGKIQDDRYFCKGKQKHVIISRQKRNRFMILVSTIGS